MKFDGPIFSSDCSVMDVFVSSDTLAFSDDGFVFAEIIYLFVVADPKSTLFPTGLFASTIFAAFATNMPFDISGVFLAVFFYYISENIY